MTSQKEMVIELSRGKLFLQIFGCFAFVALGIWMLTLDSAAIESLQRYNNPMLIYFIGALSIICFGLSLGMLRKSRLAAILTGALFTPLFVGLVMGILGLIFK